MESRSNQLRWWTVGRGLEGQRQAAAARAWHRRQLRLHCDGDRLSIPRSQWRYGPYRASLGGRLHLNQSFDLSATLKELNQDNQLAMRLDGDWSQPRFNLVRAMATP